MDLLVDLPARVYHLLDSREEINFCLQLLIVSLQISHPGLQVTHHTLQPALVVLQTSFLTTNTQKQ